MRSSAFILRTITVTRPIGVRPMTSAPRQAKCSFQSPRMKKRNELPRFRIEASDVWTLMQVAVLTAQRQIVGVVSTAMLPGNDMLDVKTEERLMLLAKAAILTAMVRPVTDELAKVGLHSE